MGMAQDKEFLRAKDCAYRLLSYRPRSVKELKDRLKKKDFSAKTIQKTVEYLRELNYLNDEEFARFWVEAKLSAAALGYALLRYQLRQKGVAREVAEKVLNEQAGQYDEYEAARRLAVSRRRHYKGLQPLKIKRRLYGYLLRRGFPQEAILQAIEQKRSREYVGNLDYR